MKGKIILTPVTNPVEGMQVVYKNTVCRINMNFDGTGSNRLIDKRGNIDLLPELLELKQLAVEYKEKKLGLKYAPNPDWENAEVLPLHPDQWNVGIALLGHEVEFKTHEDADVLPNPKRWAKLILPTPVRTIEDIPEELREFCKHINVSNDPVVNKYFQENFSIPHNHDIVLALEDFYKWQRKEILSEMMQEDERLGLYNTPVKETWDDIRKEFDSQSSNHSWFGWLKQHYLPPKRK